MKAKQLNMWASLKHPLTELKKFKQTWMVNKGIYLIKFP